MDGGARRDVRGGNLRQSNLHHKQETVALRTADGRAGSTDTTTVIAREESRTETVERVTSL